MNNIKNNKKVIIICFVMILIAVIIVILSNYRNDEINFYEDDMGIKEHYDINEINYLYVSTEDVVKKYFNDYKNNMINNKEYAYNLLNKDYREKRFGTYDKYIEYLNNNMGDSTYSAYVVKYNVNSIGGKKVYGCEDSSGYKYIFKENSIMNYEVYLDDYTVEVK